jgi:ATP-dependent Clp protease ATP-binding subunit ClpC
MFEKFTSEAIKAMVLATEEARRLRHDYIGTEHILLGLLGSDGTAAQLLKSAGMTLSQTRSDVQATLIRRPTINEQSIFTQIFGSSRDTPFIEQSKKLLDLSLEEAQEQNSTSVSDEHLLLALLRAEGAGKSILTQRGLAVDKVRETLARGMKHG